MLIILKLAIIVENKKVNCSRKTDRDRLFTTKKKKNNFSRRNKQNQFRVCMASYRALCRTRLTEL